MSAREGLPCWANMSAAQRDQWIRLGDLLDMDAAAVTILQTRRVENNHVIVYIAIKNIYRGLFTAEPGHEPLGRVLRDAQPPDTFVLRLEALGRAAAAFSREVE